MASTGTEWQCPKCYTALAAQNAEGVEIDICPSCAGLWFDAKELDRLAKSRPGMLAGLEHRYEPDPEAPDAIDPMGARQCPVCRVFMKEFEFPWAPGIKLDGCTRCSGIWVDNGELTRIEAYLSRFRTGRAPAPRSSAAAQAPLGQRVQAIQSLMSRPETRPGA
jgi:uncharacterized protein